MTDPRRAPAPLHLIAAPGDRLTLCGRDVRTKAGMPYVVARHLAAHVAGRGAVPCARCTARAGEGSDDGRHVE